MKYAIFFLSFLLCFQFSIADITQTTKKRIAELEEEIESIQNTLQEINKDKKVQEKIEKELERKIYNIRCIIKSLNKQKFSSEYELKEVNANINKSKKDISENKILLNNIIKNLNILYVNSIYLNQNCISRGWAEPRRIRNSSISNLKMCSNLILTNLCNLNQDYLVRKNISLKKEENIQSIKNRIRSNQENYNYALSTKESKQAELNLLVSLQDDYKNQMKSLKEGITSLEDFLEQIEAEKHGREYSFKFEKGIIWPVRGNIIQGFGVIRPNDSKTTIESKGIYIQAEVGAPVKSIASGIVAFSGWFENKGNLVIIDHQNGFYSLYGYNYRLAVNKGQRVEQGRIIAYSGHNLFLDEDCLYFELRKAGKAVNPLDYLR